MEPGEPIPPPMIEAIFNVTEIQRVVEEDIMIVAMDLGIEVVIEAFVRFGTYSNGEWSLVVA